MKSTHRKLIIKENRKAEAFAEVEFLIDSGAIYSLAPAEVLSNLGVEAYKEVEFVLADGTKITRQAGDAYFEYDGTGGASPVIFGEEDDEPLLGTITLESLGLVLNPFKRELYPMRMLLA